MFKNKLEFKGAVIGMVLGDATIVRRESGSCHLQFAHKKEDEDYVYYKSKILNWLNETKCKETTTKCLGKEYPCVVGRTLTHPFYANLETHMYFERRKTVNEHVMKCLTPLGLALWYCDDGTLAGEVGYRCPFICSHNFNEVENELLARMIHKKFGITFRSTRKNIKNKKYFWLRLRRRDREKFFDIIREFVPDCMRRKIDPSFYENDSRYEHKDVEEICVQCGDKFNKKIRSVRKHCSRECESKSSKQTRILNTKASVEIRTDSPTPVVTQGASRND